MSTIALGFLLWLLRIGALLEPPASPLAQRLERSLLQETPGIIDLKVRESLGIVTLRGKASDLGTRRKAVLLCRQEPGVLSVLDLLTVHPKPRPDAELRQEIFEGLLIRGPRFNAVTIRVTDAVAELSGSVQDLDARQEAEELATEVLGIRDVENRLEIQPWPKPRPSRVPDEVSWSLPFDCSTVNLLWQGDTVILRGVLRSQEQLYSLQQAMLRQKGVHRVLSEVKIRNPFEKIPGFQGPR